LQKGFAVHGIESVMCELRCLPKEQVVACWGWRRGRWLMESGKTVLITERGWLGDPTKWVGIGWNGLNGRATHTEVDDGGDRLNWVRPGLLSPWKAEVMPGPGVALIMGQVAFDSAVMHTDIVKWYSKVCAELEAEGYKVKFRPHPRDQRTPLKARCEVVKGELTEALKGVALAVTFNSTAGVDAVLAGVPTVTYDRGSMAWEVTTHSSKEQPIRPAREKWAAALAWKQWTLDEIASGFAWETVRQSMPGPSVQLAASGGRA
jgi:hypothetical protein